MFDRYRDRIFVAEMDANKPVEEEVDIVLYDSFAQQEADEQSLGLLIANPRASKVVVYTWNFHPDLISRARDLGAHGYVSKTRSSSANRPDASAGSPGWIGRVAARDSPSASRRCWRSSPKDIRTPKSPG
jgi:hypothetical protein